MIRVAWGRALKFYIDENVPRSVGERLASAGYTVILAKEATGEGAADPVVCAAAEANQCVLVSFDKDMRRAAHRSGLGGKARFSMLSLIKFYCFEPDAARRVAEALSLITHEWDYAIGAERRRIFIEIGSTYIRTHR